VWEWRRYSIQYNTKYNTIVQYNTIQLYSLKNLDPSQKTLRHLWCPKLVAGLIGHNLKIWAPLRKLFAPPAIPSRLRTWVKPSDGLAFLTNNRDVSLILRWLSTSCSKRKADWILSFNCARRYFVKSKFGYLHPLICSYEATNILLVDFDLFSRHNQWYSRGQHYTALRFPLLLMLIENCLVNNGLIMITAKVNLFLPFLKFIDADW